jgi:ABC-type phosphate/phosphonate transport system substrate-binding protein
MPTTKATLSRHQKSSSKTARGTSCLRFVTFLAPSLRGFYEFVSRHVGARLGFRVEFRDGASYEELAADVDVAFVCGLAYVELAAALEPIAAPVLWGRRYGGKPVYFSDVVVRRDSPFRSFADLRWRSWGYNETRSQSGYGIVRYHLARLREVDGYFGRVVETGWHQRSLELVCAGKIDAAAVDSHVLALWQRDHQDMADRLRVIETLGPSTVQPVVVARRLPEHFKSSLRTAFLSMHGHALARPHLTNALVRRFVRVGSGDYREIRRMRDLAGAVSLSHRYQVASLKRERRTIPSPTLQARILYLKTSSSPRT